MNVLLTGASGFIGSHLAAALGAAGHTVVAARRGGRAGTRGVDADFTRDLHARDWLPKLVGIDVVVNAVGIIREHGSQTFDRIHMRAPQALFTACVAADVRRVIQISALGAERGTTRYFTTKRAADDYLATLPLEWTIVQPGLVYGPNGASAQLFMLLASLPLIPVPGSGEQPVQPIHVEDLAAAIVHLVGGSDFRGSRIALVGPQPLPLRALLEQLRSGLGLRAGLVLPIPMALMKAGARIAELSRHSPLDRETLSMLAAGNTADATATRQILGREPRTVTTFIEPSSKDAMALRSRCAWLLPLLRFSIAAVWLWTAVVSFGLFPREASYELLARAGIPRSLAPGFLMAGAALDLLFGIATLAMRNRRLLWLAQIAVIIGYTAIISLKLPEFWLHPYGPLLKNLPMLAAIYLLYMLEPRR